MYTCKYIYIYTYIGLLDDPDDKGYINNIENGAITYITQLVRRYAYIYTHICAHVYICIIYIYIYIRLHSDIRMYIKIYINIYMYLHINIFTYTGKHISASIKCELQKEITEYD
jgi:hypothetical protein